MISCIKFKDCLKVTDARIKNSDRYPMNSEVCLSCKDRSDPIGICLKSAESDICVFNLCPLYVNCFKGVV